MRRANATSVWGTVFFALAFTVLVFLHTSPVAAQSLDNPLAEQTVAIEEGAGDDTVASVGLTIPVEDCAVASNATLTIEDENGTRVTLTNNEDVTITADANGITLESTGSNGSIDVSNRTGGNTETFDDGTGTVVRSTGITCTGNGGGNLTPAEQEYESNVNDADDVIDDTVPKKPLPKTGGIPLLLGGVVLAACATLLSVRIMRP